MRSMKPFEPLPRIPDDASIEREVLAWWESEGTFEALRKRIPWGPRWSFVDGPITANNPAAACITATAAR